MTPSDPKCADCPRDDVPAASWLNGDPLRWLSPAPMEARAFNAALAERAAKLDPSTAEVGA